MFCLFVCVCLVVVEQRIVVCVVLFVVIVVHRVVVVSSIGSVLYRVRCGEKYGQSDQQVSSPHSLNHSLSVLLFHLFR